MFDVRAYYGGKSPEAAQDGMVLLLADLRAQYWIYQTAHWQVVGQGFYGDHLLFQRLYETVSGEIDVLAEKLVGYFGTSAVDAAVSADNMMGLVQSWSETSDPYHRALRAEQDLQRDLKMAYGLIKRSADMPLGLDDWIMATASTHEAHIYLLQQRVRTAGVVDSGPAAPSAEANFFDNPEKREVRELAETKAISNDPEVAEAAEVGVAGTSKQVHQEVVRAGEAPPTPTEIVEEPGGKEFSTLNRFVVETEEPVKGLPEGHDEVGKHPDIKASLTWESQLANTYWRR